ncbi:MarR family transcriptional regulator [Halobacillus rhizosphaerae]|uniref:MarR family winged helix-turn-helix transcriptional regulator n=1 Tax=Halobacillus rhizosphaerae TaxID=3064889 RepID=UPI00398B1401
MKDFLTLENQLCFTIYETGSQFNKLYTKALQPFGVTYPQYLVLLVLWEKNGRTVKELGEKLSLGSGTLTPMIKRMETKGWLTKERSKKDERQVCLFLRPKAFEEKANITEQITREIASCNIELEEYEQLMKQLKILQHKLIQRQTVT